MKTITEDNDIQITNAKQKILYTADFEKYLTLPNIKKYINSIKILENNPEQTKVHQDDVHISLIGDKGNTSCYFKAEEKGNIFFIKHSTSRCLGTGGYEEGKGIRKTEKILLENNIDRAKIIPFKLGYSKNNNKYYISEWKDIGDMETINSFLNGYTDNKEDGRKEIYDKFQILKKLLKDFFDFAHGYNTVIDKKTKKLYIFDMTERK